MTWFAAFRMLLLAVASFGYFANGAHAHLQISEDETLNLLVCSTHSSKTVEIVVPGQPAEETEDTYCGDCAAPSAITPPRAALPTVLGLFAKPVPTHLPEAISPRSPLWPGAPPQGPPTRLTL